MKVIRLDSSWCRKIKHCRACRGKNLIRVVNLGVTPAANAFLSNKQQVTSNKERWFPLKVVWCKNCYLLQLEHVVNPQFLFSNYVYVSSVSPANLAHFKAMAKTIVNDFNLPKKSLAVDIGSNDGILLKPLAKLGMKVLGVEPAKNIAQRANAQGVPTIPKFFDSRVAKLIKKQHGQAKVITAANVFAHVDDLDNLIQAVKILLDYKGVFVIEAPYLIDLLKKNLFDTIYHEHLSYLAIKPLKVLFERLGMKMFKVTKSASHGGSIRVFVKKAGADYKVHPSLAAYLAQEKKLGLDKITTYRKFSERIEKNKRQLISFLKQLKTKKKRIVGYGASAKGNTLLNYFRIDTKILDYIVDDSVYKQGLFTPGTHIPVTAVEKIYTDKPDYLLLLAWNFAKPIMKQHRKYKQLGGKFILPLPYPKIV